MIAYVKGKITYKCPTYVWVDTGGIAYQIQISLHTYMTIQDAETVQLYTHMHVKKEGQSLSGYELYGFADMYEKEMFEQLISVSGVGANTARVMLSTLSASELEDAIVGESEDRIVAVKGIGAKTAKRIILELKDKMNKKESISQPSPLKPLHNTFKDEALIALVALGFSKSIAQKGVQKVMQSNSDISKAEDLIKLVLKHL